MTNLGSAGVVGRRRAIALVLGAGVLSVAGAGPAEAASPLAADAPLPTDVAAGTRLVIGDPTTQKALELSGEAQALPFKAEWARISGGPQTIEAFRAGALDLGSVADIPPIHAVWTGLKVKIVAAKFRREPLEHPIYQLGIAPGAGIATLADLRGKKIAYSPGQAQGALILRVLQKAGLSKRDVSLIEMPSTGDVYVNALASHLVDVAPVGVANQQRFVANYAKDGAKLLPHGLRDDPSYLYVLETVLQDPAKAAAVRAYVKAWGRATSWVADHPDQWVAGYYVKDQGLTADAGRYLVASAGIPDIPARWDEVIARQQATIDLLAAETGKPRLTAADLFDRRYESVAADAIAGS